MPARYVIHTVGPIVDGAVTGEHEGQLASCYESCLELADARRLASTAFCCISTGVFRFSNQRAAEIAVATVKEYLTRTVSPIKVISCAYKDLDRIKLSGF